MSTNNAAQPGRRRFLKTAGAAGSLTLSGTATAAVEPGDPWLQAAAIVEKLKKGPVFRAQDFVITRFGAKTCTTVKVNGWRSHHERGEVVTAAKGSHDCYGAIRAAIEAAHRILAHLPR